MLKDCELLLQYSEIRKYRGDYESAESIDSDGY